MSCFRSSCSSAGSAGSSLVTLCAIALLVSTVAVEGAAAQAPLADAAEKMDRAKIRALLEQRVDVNAPQADGMTALHWATYQDDLALAQRLVRAGARGGHQRRFPTGE